jgi:catechol 2,3-dioxygenase-like lactoylglutathione lyase family enzyme
VKSAVIKHVSAVTFAVVEIARSVGFYEALGFSVFYGGLDAKFTTMRSQEAYVNLVFTPGYEHQRWGRAIFRVEDVDALYANIMAAGLASETQPRDASWGERYFHISDPDGHELSFAQLLV